MKAVRLSNGPEVTLINISRGGALIEGDTRLQPSAGICLRLTTSSKVLLVRGRVVRSTVSGMRNGRLCYASGVRFHDELAVEEESNPLGSDEGSRGAPGPAPAREPSVQPPPLDDPGSGHPPESPSELVVTTSVPDSLADLSRIFGVNRW